MYIRSILKGFWICSAQTIDICWNFFRFWLLILKFWKHQNPIFFKCSLEVPKTTFYVSIQCRIETFPTFAQVFCQNCDKILIFIAIIVNKMMARSHFPYKFEVAASEVVIISKLVLHFLMYTFMQFIPHNFCLEISKNYWEIAAEIFCYKTLISSQFFPPCTKTSLIFSESLKISQKPLILFLNISIH